jgi:hypothetical protein
MLNKLRGAFTRARIRHPRKAIAGSAATLNGAALALIPFDGGGDFSNHKRLKHCRWNNGHGH